MRLGQRVAIKIMAGDLAANREALARFRREAEVTSRIGHPHIVHVFDVGSARTGEPFLVMEYLDGEDLERRLVRVGRLSLAATIHIVKQVSAALGAAHAKGVVHRDLKPANVFLLELQGEADFVKIVDFGISKVRAAATRLTHSAVIMGTPSYMSPEQARGRIDEIDHRTDQWALAAMAYEMLSGRSPFAGEDVAAVLYQVTREEPRALSELVRGLPGRVENVVHRALSKRPEARFASVAAFFRALQEAAEAHVDVDELQPGPRAQRSPARNATVAYGAHDPIVEPDALRGASGEDGDATVISGPPAMTGKDTKKSTFSHATGETQGFRWGRLVGGRRRMAAGVAGLALGVALWVVARRVSGPRPLPHEAQVSAAQVSARAHAPKPVISPSTSSPPPFVGPPLPPLEDLAKAQADAAARAQRLRAETSPPHDSFGRLANPFVDPFVDPFEDAETRDADRRRAPATPPAQAPPAPGAQPLPPASDAPSRPRPAPASRTLVREL